MSSAEQPNWVSVQDYLSRERTSPVKIEYIDGWVRAMTGASSRHNRVKLNCLVKLSVLLEDHPCQPYDSDTKLKIDHADQKLFYYPDAQVVCQSTDPQAVFQERPVLIIEVLSPSTRRHDLDEKMEAYLSIQTLECYIVLEQHQPIALVLRITSDGFARETVQGTHSRIELPFLGCSLRMADIYKGIEFTDTCVQEPDPQYSQL